MQVFIIFLITQVTFTFKQSFILNGLIMLVTVALIGLQLFWTVNPHFKLDRHLFLYSNSTALIIFQIVVAISFIPFKTNVSALILTASYYSVAGILHHRLENTLYKNTIREYSFVIGFVFFIALLTLSW
jgi:hypothetical protein